MRKIPGHRRRTSLKRVVLSLLVLIVVGIAGAGGVALWGMRAIEAPGPLSEPANVVIEHGQPTTEIGVVLEREGVIFDHRLFVLTTYLTRASRGDLKAGEYQFPAGASLAKVLAILRSGSAVVHKVTIPEGWTSAQAVERVNAHPALIGTVSDIPPEGSLLPDTYVFQRGLEREALIARMRDAQARVLEELWSERTPELPFETKEEAVILASIVEKETGVAEERQQVAAVFINRLRRNMRLQSDPTIIYGITSGERRLDRPIRRSDISESTPYNTYRIDGLPPTPIANPGREALAAVLQPGTTDHLYFVADGNGGHAFAETLEEHNENVKRWRSMEQAVQEDDEEPSASPDEPATTLVEAAAPAATAPDEPASGKDMVDELTAAAAAKDVTPAPDDPAQASTVASTETSADDPQAPPEAPVEATPQPKPQPKPQNAPQDEPQTEPQAEPQTIPAVTLSERAVPIPMPKPQRN